MQLISDHIFERKLFWSKWSTVENWHKMLHNQETVVDLLTVSNKHWHELVWIALLFTAKNFKWHFVVLQDASNLGGGRRGSFTVNLNFS